MSDMDKNFLKAVKISELSVNLHYDKTTRSSYCWKYFGTLIYHKSYFKKKNVMENHVFCSVCLTIAQSANDGLTFGATKIKAYSKNVSTGNLNRHLLIGHGIQQEAPQWPQTKKSKSKALKSPRASSSKPKEERVDEIYNDNWNLAQDLAVWFCRSLIPIDSICDEGMMDFFKKYPITAGPLPTRHAVYGVLDAVYETMHSQVKQYIQLNESDHGALTLELWTDRTQYRKYVTFAYHYLTVDFELKSFTLSTCMMSGANVAEKIFEAINDLRSKYALLYKTIHAVSNSEASIVRAVTMAYLNNNLCLGHGFHNLVTVDGIKSVPEVEALVIKCKKIVKVLQYHMTEQDIDDETEDKDLVMFLQQAGQHLEEDENCPILDNITNAHLQHNSDTHPNRIGIPSRWHIVLEMLGSLNRCSNINLINNVLGLSGNDDLKLFQGEWLFLNHLVTFFGKFKDAVEIMISQKTSSINVALVFRSEIKDIVNSRSDDDTEATLILKRHMRDKLDFRFPMTKEIVAATLLDCRFHAIHEVDTYLEAIHETRVSFLTSYARAVVAVPLEIKTNNQNIVVAEPNTSDTNDFLIKLSKKHSNPGSQEEDPIEQECRKYFAASSPHDLQDENLLGYWVERRTVYPWLSALARTILCIPATSTPSKHIFSAAGIDLSAKRSRLCGNRLNKILFIHDNYEKAMGLYYDR